VPGGLGRVNASTPLAVLELDAETLTLRIRPQFMQRIFGVQILVVKPDDVEVICPSRGRLRYKAIAIRPKARPPSYFLMGDRSAILSAISVAGFPVEWEERRYSVA
jgi:hypothetical protein